MNFGPASQRRGPLRLAGGYLAALLCLLAAGCEPEVEQSGRLDLIWGRRGVSDGRLQKPRAIAIDAQDRVYLVDMTARIQVFTPDGQFLRSWRTPESANGRPTGLGISRDGLLMVADTHYFRVLFYTPEGQLVPERTIGGVKGSGPGQFAFVTDCVQDAEGNYYVGEYGDNDRVQKFSPEGKYLATIGAHGSEPGQFLRPQKLEIDEAGNLWVADACNHRIQVFDREGKLVKIWGTAGSAPGQLYYPYDFAFDGRGHIYVCEYGNHRVQQFTLDGQPLGCWGTHGRGPGQLHNPWGLARDHEGRLQVLDSNNHRVQRIVM